MSRIVDYSDFYNAFYAGRDRTAGMSVQEFGQRLEALHRRRMGVDPVAGEAVIKDAGGLAEEAGK